MAKKMNKGQDIYAFADHIGKSLDVSGRYIQTPEFVGGVFRPRADIFWTASFEKTAVFVAQNGGHLSPALGRGKTPQEAITDLISQIVGKTIYVDFLEHNKRECIVPDNLSFVDA